MLSDPANRSNRFLLRLSCELGVDWRDSALLLSFIVCELWCGCCFSLSQSFVSPKKIVPVVSRSPDEAEIDPVFVF
jgi:hypothetical protein